MSHDGGRMFCCYVLQSQKNGRRYVGSCKDLNDRIRRHNGGQSKATKHGVPWVLLHSESFLVARKLRNESDTTKPDEAEMNLIAGVEPVQFELTNQGPK